MCGIAGQVGRDPRTIQRRYAAYCAMQQTLARRGPDQRGMYICGAAALIHARLAVVDLENGLQPMQLDWQGETYVLVYNGELYNTRELRDALAAFVHAPRASPAVLCVVASAEVSEGGVGSHTGRGARSASPYW